MTLVFLILFTNPLLSRQPSPSQYDRRLAQLDVQAAKCSKIMVRIPDWSFKGRTLILTLYYKDSTAVKLEYPEYDPADGTSSGKSSYYFDEQGRLYAGTMDLGANKIVRVFPDRHVVVQYSKTADGKLVKNDQDEKTRQLIEEEYAYLTDIHMQFFPSIKYSCSPPAAGAPPLLRVRKNSLPLLDSPGGRPIAHLKKEDYVNYLGRSSQQAEVNGRKYIYYKVLTAGKRSGWVWGDPTAINDDGDE